MLLNLDAWRIPFSYFPTIMQLVKDLECMCTAIPLHSLCLDYARALAAASSSTGRTRSLCMGHLDEMALGAAATALREKG